MQSSGSCTESDLCGAHLEQRKKSIGVKSGELGCHVMDPALPNNLVGKVVLGTFQMIKPQCGVALPCWNMNCGFSSLIYESLHF
jgi:hypothetical protein